MTERGAQLPYLYLEPTFGQRVLGFLIDLLVVSPALAFVALISETTARGIVTWLVVGSYVVALLAWRGQTVGKMVMRTRVVDSSSGHPVTIGQAGMRWVVFAAGALSLLVTRALEPVAAIYFFVVVAPVLLPPYHRGLHDRAARTVVVALRRSSRQ